MKPPINTPDGLPYGAFISLATDLTRGIPRELRASLASNIRDQCISMLNLLALREAGSEQAPDVAELLSRLTVIQIMVDAARAKGMVPDRAVRRMAALFDQVREKLQASMVDTAPAGRAICLPAAAVITPAMPSAAGGQRS